MCTYIYIYIYVNTSASCLIFIYNITGWFDNAVPTMQGETILIEPSYTVCIITYLL